VRLCWLCWPLAVLYQQHYFEHKPAKQAKNLLPQTELKQRGFFS
jgi:hypothetical protein